MRTFSEPEIIDHAPYHVIGMYHTYEGEDEGPGWAGASEAFFARRHEITNRTEAYTLGFLYRPHKDHPEISEAVRACFVGVDVADFDHIPEGFATTTFSGGSYVVVACYGDTEDEAAMGVGEAINMLMADWIPAHGYIEGDACFACSPGAAERPPFVEYVYIKLEPQS